MLALPLLVAVGLAARTAAQDLGGYLSICEAPTPYAEVQVGSFMGYKGLGDGAQCSASSIPDSGYAGCPTAAYYAFLTDTQMEFECATSLDSTCGGGCPSGSSCLSTTLPGGAEHYFCGVSCAGGFWLCDNAAAKILNPNYVAYCTADSDQCGTCASSGDLTGSGCSKPITAFPPSGTNSAVSKRRAEQAQAARRNAMAQSPLCPVGMQSCPVPGVQGETECVDTKEDIESCGGCIGFGGVDCSALPGVTLGYATCRAGVCVASGCEKGYKLDSSSTCVPTSSLVSRGISAGPVDPTPEPTNPSLILRDASPEPLFLGVPSPVEPATRPYPPPRRALSIREELARVVITTKDQLKVKAWQVIAELTEYSGQSVGGPIA